MKRIFVVFLATALLQACGNGNNKTNDASDSSGRPRDVNEAVTNDTKIVNDSVIVPDTNNTGTNPSSTDTSGKKMD